MNFKNSTNTLHIISIVIFFFIDLDSFNAKTTEAGERADVSSISRLEEPQRRKVVQEEFKVMNSFFFLFFLFFYRIGT